MQIKLSYSVHRNLNVRVNNERGWDYTGANTPADVGDGAPGGAPPVASAGGINGLAVGLEDAPSGACHPGSCRLHARQARQPWVRGVASWRPFCWAAEVATQAAADLRGAEVMVQRHAGKVGVSATAGSRISAAMTNLHRRTTWDAR